MLTNSRWPPRSQIEKVISVLRIEMVFSMKLTPLVVSFVLVLVRYLGRHSYREFECNPRPSCPRRI